MKRLILSLAVALTALTACNKSNQGDAYEPPTPKYVDKITHADGSVISLSYDEDMRVSAVNYVDATNANNNCNYEIKYNHDTSSHEVTFDIFYGNKKYVMEFNEYGALDEYVDGLTHQTLSSFFYDSYTSIAAFHLELDKVKDMVTGNETTRIDWNSEGLPVYQINQRKQSVDGTLYTYSTAITYEYLAYQNNVLANVNLFNLLTPEFLEYSNIPTVLTATVSVFGTRSTYLPTNVTLTYGRSQEGENYIELSATERIFSYERNEDGHLVKIYSGEDTKDTKKELLYTITYVGDKEED